jgi:hypothetical protein
MENVEIYGTRTKNAPGLNTVKTLEKRKGYIIKYVENKIVVKESYFRYLIKEIIALEKAINFIQWIQNNNEDETIKETLRQYELEKGKEIENDENYENEIGRYNEKKENIYKIYEEKFNQNHFVEITLSKNDGIDYIQMESKRRKNNKVTWRKEGKIKMTVHKLEKIIEKANNFGNANSVCH